jgi:hypothetical protein
MLNRVHCWRGLKKGTSAWGGFVENVLPQHVVWKRGPHFSHEHVFIFDIFPNVAHTRFVARGPCNKCVRVVAVFGSRPIHQSGGLVDHIFQIVYDEQQNCSITLVGHMSSRQHVQHLPNGLVRFGQADHLTQVFMAEYAPRGMNQMHGRGQ